MSDRKPRGPRDKDSPRDPSSDHDKAVLEGTLPPPNLADLGENEARKSASSSAAASKPMEARETHRSATLSLVRERVHLAAGGDRRAQTWLLERVMPTVRKVTRALLRHAPDADDAAQMSMIEILRSAGSYRGDAAVEHWARRITVRTSLRYIRRERTRQPSHGAEPEPLDRTCAPNREPAWEQLPRDVTDYLAELPELQREAIVLHHALGYAIDEIAQLTDVSPNTVKGRLRLGTKTLRKLVRRELLIGAPERERGGGA